MTRGKKVWAKCAECSADIYVRIADRNRGWARYCSKTCKAIAQGKEERAWTKMENKQMTDYIFPTRTVYTVYTNTDLTEGRGYQIVKTRADNPVTAARLAKGEYVQGADCPVREETAIQVDGKWYAPLGGLEHATREDQAQIDQLEKEQRAQAARDAVIERMRAAGFTDEDIAALDAQKE